MNSSDSEIYNLRFISPDEGLRAVFFSTVADAVDAAGATGIIVGNAPSLRDIQEVVLWTNAAQMGNVKKNMADSRFKEAAPSPEERKLGVTPYVLK